MVKLSLGLGGRGDGGGRHSCRGDSALVGISGEVQVEGSGGTRSSSCRHQADRVTGEQRQVLRVQKERRRHQVRSAASAGVGKQQVPAPIQRCYGQGATRCQSAPHTLDCGQGAVAHQCRTQSASETTGCQTQKSPARGEL